MAKPKLSDPSVASLAVCALPTPPEALARAIGRHASRTRPPMRPNAMLPTPLFHKVADFPLRAQNSARVCSRAYGGAII